MVTTCWDASADLRPKFSELVLKISSFLGSIAEYFDLTISNPATLDPAYDPAPDDIKCDATTSF